MNDRHEKPESQAAGQIDLQIVPVNLNGKLKHRVFARRGKTVLHSDTFDLASASSRSRFIKGLIDRAARNDVAITADKVEQALLTQT